MSKVQEACQNGTIRSRIKAEKDEEDAQRRNRYSLAEEDDGGSKAIKGSESEGSEFDSSGGDDEEARDHIME